MSSNTVHSSDQSEDKILQYVTFRLDDETYGINVMQIQEVLRYSEIAPVPGAPHYVLGIINLRGNVVTVIDTRTRFGLAQSEVSDQTRIVVLELEGQVVGVLVDSVAEVVYLKESEIETAPNVGNDESARFIQGVCNKNGELIILVEFEKMLSEEEWAEMVAL
ncbi:chemotaxis protein CheW [Oleiphilus sp. HI0071]|jgi:purine-binding chemotaxis protein CheW|nr:MULTISPECIES: chemotaxis protein CheW [unclassified Oleiphilus]KZY74932.1 chemotaxis protein CheW [Oleiphilus sp. HI0065]KZY80038.1 chemotaxis protein CheW [Oleiphilus sp. HI0071]KZY91114.1 chemotaxis protein CheW [Oleiphilus sp. HI0073]KZZ39825.1 chemotaxis protein CheW [Oleiphilus sp. HI0118]KZZ52729.1 chemotaxis protein CheW [Oleiphilus sp. HI0122]KZZ71258.1 chemotaxis protein CheW [Oleiphilus sp. HI0130]KZZ81941.1 chemotaxis protein CheW [Oleiphilus sp. HI0133]